MTVAFCERAVAQGAEVLVITDNSLSELAEKGTVTLYADIDSTFFVHSLVGPIGLVGALAAAVYGRNRDLHDARVRAIRDRSHRIRVAALERAVRSWPLKGSGGSAKLKGTMVS